MSSKIAKITIADQVNVLISGIDKRLSKKIDESLKWRKSGYFFSPKYKLGVWDGYIHLYKSGWTYLNLINEDIFNLILSHGYEISMVDHRIPNEILLDPIASDYFAEYIHPKTQKPTLLRNYQVGAINIAIENSSGMFLMGTGSGKTLTCAGLASRFKAQGRVLIIVPTVDLVVQTAKALNNVGLECGEFYANKKELKKYSITTWQSATNYPEILEGVTCIIADECHEYSADEVFSFLTIAAKDVPYRYGFTATLPKDKLRQQKIRAVLGEVLYTKPSHELQQEGYLSTCEIIMMETQEPADAVFDKYQKERAYICSFEPRAKAIGDIINQIGETGNTLILVATVKQGELLKKYITDCRFISGSGSAKTTSSKRKEEYQKIEDEDNQKLMATSKIASTGIDVARWFNIVLIDAQKDYIEVLQSIGRGLRLAQDKKHLVTYDISSSLKFAKSQKRKRKKYYREAKYPYVEEKLWYNEIYK
jgi:superfamily II DNA or RNA helicase